MPQPWRAGVLGNLAGPVNGVYNIAVGAAATVALAPVISLAISPIRATVGLIGLFCLVLPAVHYRQATRALELRR